MRYRGLVPGLTGVVRADTRFTRRVNICCQLPLFFLTVLASLFFNRTSSCHCPFSVIGHISFPRKLGYITSFLRSLSKTSYQYLGLCLFNADKEVCFTVGTHPPTIRELELAGYLPLWAATVNRCEHRHKYNSKF